MKEIKDYNSFLYHVLISSIFVLNNQNLILSCPVKPFHAPIYIYSLLPLPIIFHHDRLYTALNLT